MRRQTERLIAACLLCWAAAAGAETRHFALTPFTAVYSAALNGMPVGFDLTIELKPEGRDWRISLAAADKGIHYAESSVFRWHDCDATPLVYRYEFRGYGIDRKLWLDFDHQRGIATGINRRGPVTYDMPPEAADDLSLSFAARCRLLAGEKQSTFRVATTTGLKDFTYRLEGSEQVKTRIGVLDTLRIVRVRKEGEKRRSTMWIAPSLQHMLVKVEHVERFGVRGMVVLKDLAWHPLPTAGAGVPVTPSAR